MTSFLAAAVQNQTKQQSSDKEKSEPKPTRGYQYASRKYMSLDGPLYQNPLSPPHEKPYGDYKNYRDTNMSLSSERYQTLSPQYTTTLYGNQQPYDDKSNEYGMNRSYDYGSQPILS